MGRDEIVTRIQVALTDVAGTDLSQESPVSWTYGEATQVDDVLELFKERVEDYKAVVLMVEDESAIQESVLYCLKDANATSLVVPPGLDVTWYDRVESSGIKVHVDDPPLSKLQLNETEAVLTASALGMAETGTIALDHRADQGRRIITLLPDTHVCVVRADNIYSDVPESLAHLAPSIREGQPVTWISGPSATSDIELIRVEGVHGPRNLYVIVVC